MKPLFVSVWITFQVLGVLEVTTPNYGHVEDSDDELRWTCFCGGPYFQTPILVLCISFCSVLPRLRHLQNWRNHTPTCDKAWQDANFLGSEKPWSSRLWTPRILGVSFLGVDVYPHVLKSWGPIKSLEDPSKHLGRWGSDSWLSIRTAKFIRGVQKLKSRKPPFWYFLVTVSMME